MDAIQEEDEEEKAIDSTAVPKKNIWVKNPMQKNGGKRSDTVSESKSATSSETETKVRGRVRKPPRLSFFSAARIGAWAMRAQSIRGKGIPVREGLQVLFRINRRKFVYELALFMLYFLLFFFIVSEAYDVHEAFSTDNVIMDLVLDEEFENATYKKNFEEIMTMQEFWSWLKGPILNGLYPEAMYNDEPIPEDQRGYILEYLRLIGGVQLRQLRVTNNSCVSRRFLDLGDRFDTKDGTCFAEFEPASEDKSLFLGKYAWSGSNSPLEGFYGFGPEYGNGGYTLTLPLDRVNATKIVNQLESDRYVDRGTRAVLVSFNLYNTNTRLLSVVRLLVEFYHSARVQPSFRFITMQPVLYESKLGLSRLVAEVCYCIMWVFYLQKQIRRFLRASNRKKYFTKPKNLFEIVYLALNLLVMIEWMLFVFNSERRNMDVNVTDFHDMFVMADHFEYTLSLAGMNYLMSALKLFMFLNLWKQMQALWLTLQRASLDLLAFGLGFVIIVAGFAMFAMLGFGGTIKDFHGFVSSFSTLMRYPLGDFNYDALGRARPQVTGPFFMAYVGIVILVILNMFIAIVTSYFDTVRAEAKVADEWQHAAAAPHVDVLRIVYFMYLKFKRKYQLGSVDEMTFQEWEKEQNFEELMHDCMREAKNKNNIDLYAYFERAHMEEEQEGENRYIGFVELCSVLTKMQDCKHEDCLAKELVRSYNTLKEVVIVGGRERHNVSTSVRSARKMYKVWKLNRSGVRQLRYIYVYHEGRELINCNKKMQFRRLLPLSTLLQIEKNNVDPTRLSLVFTRNVCVGRDTTYNVIFENKPAREAFTQEVLECCQKMEEESKREKQSELTLASHKVQAQILTLSGRVKVMQNSQLLLAGKLQRALGLPVTDLNLSNPANNVTGPGEGQMPMNRQQRGSTMGGGAPGGGSRFKSLMMKLGKK